MLGCRATAVAALAACLLAPSVGSAHGGPASVEVVAVNRNSPQRMAVGTSYGLAATSDGGATWSLTCEGAIGESGTTHPRIAITADGALLAGVFSGAVASDASGCDYHAINDLAGHIPLDLQNVPGDPHGVIALTRQGAAYLVWRSFDDGESWVVAADDFGPKFVAHSVAATSDPDRFYVGGLTATDGLAALMVTEDGGQTFNAVLVPNADAAPNDPLFVEAVDPADPRRLVAALYEPPSKVLLSTDGGASWSELFEGWTVLAGLAVSPAFDTIVTGSPAMGLWRVVLPSGAPEQVSDVPVRCLTWTDDALLICTDDSATGYAVLSSTDQGATLTPLLELRCLQRPPCESNSQVEAACAAEWSSLVSAVGIEACETEIGKGAGGSTAAGGGDAAGGSAAPLVRYTPVGGCTGCTSSRTPHGPTLLGLGFALAALSRRRRVLTRHGCTE